jgi:iron complex outermembrane recepter protein
MRYPTYARWASVAGVTALAFLGTLDWGVARCQQVAAASGDNDAISEVVVTARKREENLQNTPIAISAYSAADIESRALDNLSQIAASTPSLAIAPAPQSGNPGASSVFLRGVGQLDFTLFTDPGVGIYLDGVYIARSIGSMLDFVDIQRIEVLRGPQGTLFGRNTIGGAVNVISAPPSHELGGSAILTTGKFDRIQFQGNVSIPLSDTFLTKFSGFVQKRDGYVERVQTGQDVGNDNALAGRAQFLWDASSNFTVQLSVDATRRHEHPGALVLLQASGFGFSAAGQRFTTPHANPPTAFNQRLGGVCATNPDSSTACWGAAQVTGDPFKTNDTFGNANDLDIWGTNLTLDWNLGPLAVKSITAYRDLRSNSVRDTDHSPFSFLSLTFDDTQNQLSEELQFTGSAFQNRLKMLFGLYYFKEHGTESYDSLNAVTFDGVANINATNTNYAAFTENTFDITNRLHLTAGLRWTHEEKQFQVFYPVTQDFNGPAPPSLGSLIVGDDTLKKRTFEKATPRYTFSADVTDDVMAYATYSEGFKSGGYNGRYTAPVPAPIPFNPEFIKQYEVGLKYQGHRVRFNLAAFHSKYTDIQISYRPDPTQVLTVIGNAAEGRIDGVEAEFSLVPVHNLRIEGGLSYLDAKYTHLDGGLAPAGVTLNTPFVNTPEVSGNLSVSYNFALGASGSVMPRIDYSYRTKVALDNTNSLFLRQPAVGLLSASVGWMSADELWRVALGGTNLSDERYLVTGAFNGAGGLAEGLYGRPREWYLSLRRSF